MYIYYVILINIMLSEYICSIYIYIYSEYIYIYYRNNIYILGFTLNLLY